MAEVEVRIRQASDREAVPFTYAPVDELERLMARVSGWGVVDADGDATEDIAGQFVVKPGLAYFEIVIGG